MPELSHWGFQDGILAFVFLHLLAEIFVKKNCSYQLRLFKDPIIQVLGKRQNKCLVLSFTVLIFRIDLVL